LSQAVEVRTYDSHLQLLLRHASRLGTFSKADARDLTSGQSIPEAPRSIFDLLGSLQKLPWHPQARGEFEYVGAKSLGTGCDPGNSNTECTGVPVKEFRAALVRPFLNGRTNLGVNILLASGCSGQTTQSFYPSGIREEVGVRSPSYASLTPHLSLWTLAAPKIHAPGQKYPKAATGAGPGLRSRAHEALSESGSSDVPSVTFNEIPCVTLVR